jgi:hypothetical protein
MRNKLAAAVLGVLEGADAALVEPLADRDAEWLFKLVELVTLSRSAVERDRYRREIDDIPAPEAPARLVQQLDGLYAGLIALGVIPEATRRLVARVAFDSMPQNRRYALGRLVDGEVLTTTAMSGVLGLPTVTTRRVLEDLTAHGLLLCHKRGDEGHDSQAHKWARAPLLHQLGEGLGDLADLLRKNTQTEKREDKERGNPASEADDSATLDIADKVLRCPACGFDGAGESDVGGLRCPLCGTLAAASAWR